MLNSLKDYQNLLSENHELIKSKNSLKISLFDNFEIENDTSLRNYLLDRFK